MKRKVYETRQSEREEKFYVRYVYSEYGLYPIAFTGDVSERVDKLLELRTKFRRKDLDFEFLNNFACASLPEHWNSMSKFLQGFPHEIKHEHLVDALVNSKGNAKFMEMILRHCKDETIVSDEVVMNEVLNKRESFKNGGDFFKVLVLDARFRPKAFWLSCLSRYEFEIRRNLMECVRLLCKQDGVREDETFGDLWESFISNSRYRTLQCMLEFGMRDPFELFELCFREGCRLGEESHYPNGVEKRVTALVALEVSFKQMDQRIFGKIELLSSIADEFVSHLFEHDYLLTKRPFSGLHYLWVLKHIKNKSEAIAYRDPGMIQRFQVPACKATIVLLRLFSLSFISKVASFLNGVHESLLFDHFAGLKQ